MSIKENNPTILVAPSRQEVQIFDPDQEDGVRIAGEFGLKTNLHQYATILGELATRGVGTYTGSEIAKASGLDSKTLSGKRGKILTSMLPEYVLYDKGFQVLQDFSIAVAPEQPGDVAVIAAKKRAARAKRRQEKLEAREQHITSLKDRLNELVAEATYTDEDVERLNEGKTNLYNFDSVRFTVTDQGEDYVVPLMEPEDIVTARIFMELASSDSSELDTYSYDGMAQRIWDAMPHEERTVFANTYRSQVPGVFMRMFTAIATQLGHNRAFNDPNEKVARRERAFTTRPMRHVENVLLLTEQPADDGYTEFAVDRYNRSNFPEDRHKQWMDDKNERRSVVMELRSLGVHVAEQIRPIAKKAQLQYTPESQIELKPSMAETITGILSGELEQLTQPQAMEIIHAANNARLYRAIETIGARLEEPVSLDHAVEKLNEAAQTGLGDSYHGFATRNHTIGRATVKRLHRR